ncbi:hypothetical protein HPB51_020039 [Rhipicephalus microplus]|uniref:Uncharacterized protein n=1 Tax=Rhipicephalus microplus TaxID=6941 RepID=A0A9J6DBW2_RHIMP|nr:hypothetical protein HPB51_020039 [Rhipicephalus microplus]
MPTAIILSHGCVGDPLWTGGSDGGPFAAKEREGEYVGDSLPGLVLVDQMAEQADSPSLQLVPVVGGQFVLAKMAGLPPDEENSLAGSTSAQDDLATQLAELQAEVMERLEGISNKLSAVETRYSNLGDKIHSLTTMLQTPASAGSSASTPSSETSDLPAP